MFSEWNTESVVKGSSRWRFAELRYCGVDWWLPLRAQCQRSSMVSHLVQAQTCHFCPHGSSLVSSFARVRRTLRVLFLPEMKWAQIRLGDCCNSKIENLTRSQVEIFANHRSRNDAFSPVLRQLAVVFFVALDLMQFQLNYVDNVRFVILANFHLRRDLSRSTLSHVFFTARAFSQMFLLSCDAKLKIVSFEIIRLSLRKDLLPEW